MWRWRVRYDGYGGQDNGGFFSLHKQAGDGDMGRRQSQMQVMPWSDQFRPALNSIYIPSDEPDDDEFVVVDEVGGYDRHSWVKVEDTSGNSTSKTIDLPGSFPKFYPNFWQHLASFENENSVKVKAKVRDFDTNVSEETKEAEINDLYGNHRPMFMAVFVRLLLIAHNVMTIWRVTEAYDNNMYWLMVLANFFLIFEGQIVVVKRHGMDYSWWCPCFMFYLASTLPAIWLLQLNQYERFVESQTVSTVASPLAMASTTMSTTVTQIICSNLTSVNMTSTPSVTTLAATTTVASAGAEAPIGTLDNNVWVIIVEESLVYLLVISRWLLPRGNVSRDFLSDLLLEFLAIASDIMELLAVFDEDRVRGNLPLTYAVLAIWSASFIQFVPILMQKRSFRRVRSPRVKGLARVCGEHFVEIVVTCMSIFLQDLPFLVIRLYIMIAVQLVTYSLIFFVLKNIVTLMLLFYRLAILCYRTPSCRRTDSNKVKNPDGLY